MREVSFLMMCQNEAKSALPVRISRSRFFASELGGLVLRKIDTALSLV